MDTSPVTQNQQIATAATRTTGVGNSALGRDDFLMLLVTQLQNQNPLEPQTANEFTAQLAQFSSLEQLFNVNDTLSTLASLQAAVTNTQATGLIGRQITAYGQSISVADGQVSRAEFQLPDDAQNVKVTISDSQGNVVRVLELGPLGEGTHTIDWNGLRTDGTPAPDGTYSFTVEAEDAQGKPIQADCMVTGIVTGIDFDTTGTYLLIGTRRVALADLVGVRAVAEQ